MDKTQDVAISRCDYTDIDLDSLLAPLGGMRRFVKRGERVLLKVNLLSASEPSSGVTTHPAVVAAVADAVQREGAFPYIGDSPSGRFTRKALEKVYNRSGLDRLSRDMGVELNYDTSSKRVTVSSGKKLKNMPVGNFALKADRIIALPKIKTHSFMVMTLATKIMFGTIPGLTKARYHSMFPKRNDFADMLLDVLSASTPDLFIMDGILAMEGNGPQNGKPVELGVMLASEDAIAMDLAVCEMLSIEPELVPTLKRARIGRMLPSGINYPLLRPEEAGIKKFKLPSTVKKAKRRPQPTENCTGCGKCEEICPRNAIKLIDRKARVDHSICIRCYCCHEVCPANAIKLVR